MSSRREISDVLTPWRKSFPTSTALIAAVAGLPTRVPLLPGMIQPGADAFAKDIVFESSKHGEHAGHRSSGGCGQIERFAE